MTSKSKRIKWLGFAKGVTILDVLLIHTSSFITSSRSVFINHMFKFINFILCIPAMPIFLQYQAFYIGLQILKKNIKFYYTKR